MPHPVGPPPAALPPWWVGRLVSLPGLWMVLPLGQPLALVGEAEPRNPSGSHPRGTDPALLACQFQSVERVIPCDLGSSHCVCDLGGANLRIIRKVNASCALVSLFSLSPLWACWGALGIFLSNAFLLLGKCVCMKSDVLSAWNSLLERGIQNMTSWYHCKVKWKNVHEVNEHRAQRKQLLNKWCSAWQCQESQLISASCYSAEKKDQTIDGLLENLN